MLLRHINKTLLHATQFVVCLIAEKTTSQSPASTTPTTAAAPPTTTKRPTRPRPRPRPTRPRRGDRLCKQRGGRCVNVCRYKKACTKGALYAGMCGGPSTRRCCLPGNPRWMVNNGGNKGKDICNFKLLFHLEKQH